MGINSPANKPTLQNSDSLDANIRAPPVVLIVLVLNATTGRNIVYRKTTPVIGDSRGEPTLGDFISITDAHIMY